MPVSVKRAYRHNLDCIEGATRTPIIFILRGAGASPSNLAASWILAGNGETESIFTVASGLKPRRAMKLSQGFRPGMAGRWRKVAAKFVAEMLCTRSEMAGNTDAILEALTPDLDCLFL